MKWIFKSSDNFPIKKDGAKATFRINQKRQFSGKVGEDVLILQKKNEEWKFTDHYQIAEIESANPQEENKVITITLMFVKSFGDEKRLEDYIYSLRRISNFANPIKHFSRKYNRLYDAEFYAIVEDKIFLKRTIIGTILNALHLRHQQAFISYISVESPKILVNKVDIDKLLELLLDYLRYSVIKPAQYLRESAAILNLIITEDEFSEIGFGRDPENLAPRNVELIEPQVKVIDAYLDQIISIYDLGKNLAGQNLADNARFERLFKNARLPITLR